MGQVSLQVSQAIPAIATVCYTALSVVVYLQSTRERTHQVFLLYLIGNAIWSLGSFMWRLQASLFWNRILVGGVTVTAILFYTFVVVFLEMKTHRHWLYLGYGLCAATLIANVLGYVVRDTYFVDGVARYEIGPAILLIGLYGYFYYGLSMYSLIQRYRKTRNRLYRNRVQYLILGLCLIMLAGASNFAPELGKYPIDIAASLINAFLIAFAILRHHLLDISIIIRKGLVYSIPTAALAIAYFCIIIAAESVLRSFVGYQVFFLSFLVAAATAVAVQPLRDRIQLWIDKLFFREKHDAYLMLQEVSELAGSILDIEKLSSLLLDRLTATMHIRQACIMLRDERTARYHITAQKGLTLSGDEIFLHEEYPVVQWLTQQRRSLNRHDLDMRARPRALSSQEHGALGALEAELLVPLLIREELIGILILGPKLSEALYSQDEELTLTTLANQTAVAIQNARLYSDLERSLETLQQMQTQLVQSEKLSAIGEMIAGVAHEINNPLTAVIGYSQLLQMQSIDQDAQIHDDLGQILEAGMRMKRIVANLLDFSRQHQPQKEYVDINQIISTSLALRMNELTNNNIEVHTDLVSDLPWTLADRHQLQQVFVNIINNAQQAMIEKGGPGKLTVSTRPQRNNTILIRFQDTGPGIPEEIMSRIFDPFFTTKEVGKGTGLGLSVSYGIVNEHEGRIWAESEDGRGATFLIELPIRKSDGSADRELYARPVLAGGRAT